MSKYDDLIEECKHQWKMFHDKNLKNTNMLSFYCIHCLKLNKIKKDYEKQ